MAELSCGKKTVRALIFDMDGVLIDSEPGYNRAERKLFEKLGLTYDSDAIAAVTGANNFVVADIIAERYPEFAPRRSEVAGMYEDSLYGALIEDVDGLIPGVEDWMLRARAAGLKIAIGSSSSDRMVFHVIESFGLAKLLDAVVTGDMTPRGKPHPDIFLSACARLNLPPRSCMIIEDSVNGLAAGRAAGTVCAAYTGTNRHGLDLSGCDISFAEFTPNTWNTCVAPFL